MNEQVSSIEGQIAEQLTKLLGRVPDVKPVSLRRNMRIAGSEVDIDSVVEIGDRQHEILVDVKSDGSPSVLRRAASQLKLFRDSFPDG